jgi:hypothetical protein
MTKESINDGGPAFPCVYYSEPIGSIGPQLTIKGGVSIRDYFAAAALQGLLSKLPIIDQTGVHGIKVDDKIAYNNEVAESCYQIADAMLKAREFKP